MRGSSIPAGRKGAVANARGALDAGSPVDVLRTLADQVFSRTAGAPLIAGNQVRLLRDAAENYPAWLDAIATARHHVHFENYIVYDDSVGRTFADALIDKAREGVRVRVIYDWLGCFGKASRRFWDRLRREGVEVRRHNPPRVESPFGWLSRDHRKVIVVDGEVAFLGGLCVGKAWAADPARGLEPWRDTGIEMRGPAVTEVERAFHRMWALIGEPLPESPRVTSEEVGTASVRIMAVEPATASLLRVDQLVTALARRRLWLTDAYYGGTAAHVQALAAAAREGVDVRLLVPSATDIPVFKPITRATYRPLLEAGVRIFEWNGPMLHAKSAVADGTWARVGSSNANLVSWLGNYELDAIIQDAAFGSLLEDMFLEDLTRATEIVLAGKRLVSSGETPARRRRARRMPEGSGQTAAVAARLGNTIGASVSARRVLEPGEIRIVAGGGIVGIACAVLFAVYPGVLAYPVAVLLAWASLALLYRAFRMRPAAASPQRADPASKPG